jgi:hypothetical protein
MGVNARTLMVTSPQHKRYHAYSKTPLTTIRYMPVWTHDEIKTCWHKLYKSTMDEEFVEDLYSKWGGIARQVLEQAKDQGNLPLLEKAISSCDMDACIRSVGEISNKDDASHRIVHIIVEDRIGPDGAEVDPFIHTHIEFASAYVADQVTLRFWEQQRKDLLTFLKSSAGEGGVASLRGNMFEALAHKFLRRGGKFNVRPLDSDTIETKDLPPMQLRLFSNLTEVDVTKIDTYYRPVSKSLAAVDALASDMLFQMTVSPLHPINMAGLAKAVKQVPIGMKPALYFVVPSEIFKSMRWQSYVTDKNKVAVQIDPEVLSVQQYALCIDLFDKSVDESLKRKKDEE